MISPQNYYKKLKVKYIPDSIIKSLIDEILFLSQKELKKPAKSMSVLDVGSGFGTYDFELENRVKSIEGIEPYKDAYLKAIKEKKTRKSKILFYNQLVENYISKKQYDLIICLTAIEHMKNAEQAFSKIFDLMKDNSVLYLTAPNKWWPIEQHYKLPFLAWLPLPIANLYLRIMNKGDTYEDCSYSKSYFGMKNFFNKYPCQYKFVLPLNTNAAYLGLGKTNGIENLIRCIGIFLISKFPIFWVFSKGFILLIKKRTINSINK
jgi:2-polyprenyl-3-methyl-5-hydroxy-6-metoxy-1,4-benzoquinol methylase